MPAGAPKLYNRKEVLERLRTEMAKGTAMDAACALEGMPTSESIYLWIQEEEELFTIFMRAQELWCLAQKDLIIKIADDQTRDFQPDGEGGIKSDNTAVNRDRLRVQTRQWAMTKLAKKHFGDEVKNEHSGPNGGPIKYEGVDRPPAETHEQWTARVKKQIKDK